jgi:hypothetical protein
MSKKTLTAYNGELINVGDIIKNDKFVREEKQGLSEYFLYDVDEKGAYWLYRYSIDGKLSEEFKGRWHIGAGESLSKSGSSRWIKVGERDKVYDRLFNV